MQDSSAARSVEFSPWTTLQIANDLTLRVCYFTGSKRQRALFVFAGGVERGFCAAGHAQLTSH